MAITRIKANDTNVVPRPKKAPKVKTPKVPKPRKGLLKIFGYIGDYFKGAWTELRQVRWPDRKSAWKLTLAVIAFTGFFVGLIILLDYLFNLLFKVILK